MKTPWEDLITKATNFVDFVRFRPHIYARTQQTLLPFMDGSKAFLKCSKRQILKILFRKKSICTNLTLKYTKKDFFCNFLYGYETFVYKTLLRLTFIHLFSFKNNLKPSF